MIAFVEIILTIVGILLLIAFVWSIFDHRDLRIKYNQDRMAMIEKLAEMEREIGELKIRMGV